jgi:hypothetical protein
MAGLMVESTAGASAAEGGFVPRAGTVPGGLMPGASAAAGGLEP